MSENLENETFNLSDMEIKKLDSIISHLAIENVFNSNLIDDIGYVDYTENSKGFTCLKRLEGLPDFIDDLYVFKYIHESEIDKKTINKNKLELNKGKNKSASLIVDQIDNTITELFGISCKQKTAFLVNLKNEKKREKSIIYQTLKYVERRTDKRAFKGYINYRNCEKPVAVIKYKVKTSSLPLKKVLDNLETLEKRLNLYGAGLMSIDYTRDLSGVLEKKRMIEHFLNLGFIEQSSSEEKNKKYYVIDEFTKFHTWEEKTIKDGDEDENENEFKIKIIDSDATCGRNTFKYIKNIGSVCCVIKYYNKIVSNFEAGDVQQNIGSHLAEYVFTHSCEHLEKTFRHPDVVERGLTRLEISIHGFDPKINYSQMLDEEFNLIKDAQIFHIQPGAEQWLRLAKHITQCALFANKTTNEITLFWYGSSVTKRAAGVTKKLKKKYTDANPQEWEQAIKWMILNFGFNGLPIYKIVLDVEEKQNYDGKTYKEVKTEDTKTEDTKTEDTKTEDTKTEEVKTEDTKTEDTKTEDTKTEDTKTEEVKTEDTKTEEVKTEEVKTEDTKTEEVKTEEVKTEDTKTEEVKTEEQPKRKRGRPTRREEEERRNKLTEEERTQEDELKERRRQQREERKRIKAEELAAEAERLKNLSREEREREEERKRKEEERKQKIDEERKKELAERKKEKRKKEGLKVYINNFSYFVKKGPTFLTPFGSPAKMYISTNEEVKIIKEPPCPKDEIFNYPSTILPDTKNIQFRFRTEKDHKRIGKKKLPKYTLEHFENPGKKLSTNSTRQRNKILNLENEKNRQWIKEKFNFTSDAKRIQTEKIKNKIKTNLKETETIALYEERKDTIDGVFRCFTDPEEIDNVLNENEYIHIFAFKVYPNCTRIAYKVQDETKVCFANPLMIHILDGLRDTCFNMLPKEETKYKPEYPVYFMPYASLKAKGEDGNDLKIIDEIDGKEVKKFNEMLEQHYGDWEELRRLEKLKTPMMEEVFEEVVKPTATVKLEPGEYTAYKYLKRTYRGNDQIIVYIKREDEREEPIYGYWLSEELKKIDLTKTMTPIYIRLGGTQSNPSKHKDRLATILSTQTD